MFPPFRWRFFCCAFKCLCPDCDSAESDGRITSTDVSDPYLPFLNCVLESVYYQKTCTSGSKGCCGLWGLWHPPLWGSPSESVAGAATEPLPVEGEAMPRTLDHCIRRQLPRLHCTISTVWHQVFQKLESNFISECHKPDSHGQHISNSYSHTTNPSCTSSLALTLTTALAVSFSLQLLTSSTP